MSISLTWLESQFPDLEQLAVLNSGGQKEVFSAQHPRDGAVVLKIIHPHQGIEVVSREMLAVQQVQSPRVPRVLESGQIVTQLGQCFWLREQRVIGQTLRQVIRRSCLTPTKLFRLALQMLEALAQAEAVRIVHRDVKPDNIIEDQAGDYWLLDFGIARHLSLESLTATAHHFGKFTAGYAPPEQFRNKKLEIDARSDLFGLGITIYECATGSNPFRHGVTNHLQILDRTEKLTLAPLNLTCDGAGEFADLISTMTQKRREFRPSTAREAYEWMREITEGTAS